MQAVVAALLIGLATGTKTTCNTSIEGESAKIMCHFPVDISTNKCKVSVHRYKLDSQSSSPEHIFGCTWLPTGDPLYIASPGYTLDGKLTTTLTLSVKQLNSRFEGRYTCQIISYSPENIGECFLEFEVPDGTTATPVTSTSCRPENVTDVTEDGEADENVTTIAVAIAVTVIALVVIAAVVVVCFIRKRTSNRRNENVLHYSRVNQNQNVDSKNLHETDTRGPESGFCHTDTPNQHCS